MSDPTVAQARYVIDELGLQGIGPGDLLRAADLLRRMPSQRKDGESLETCTCSMRRCAHPEGTVQF